MQGYVKADHWVVRGDNTKTITTKDLQLYTSVFQKVRKIYLMAIFVCAFVNVCYRY
jgi:hypothetical protein